jgi:isochorismate synthase
MVEQLSDDLRAHVKELELPKSPVLFDAGRLIHLATPMRGQLLPGGSVTGIILAIAPTAAVSGVPRVNALEMLRVMEPYRGYYAGIAGITDPYGDGEIYLTIRGGRVHEGALDLVAGAGIVSDSDIDAEIAEIEAKFDVVSRALGTQ